MSFHSNSFHCCIVPYEPSLSFKGAIQINLPGLAKFSTSPCNINRLYKILWAKIIAAIKADLGSRNTNIHVVNRKDLQILSARRRIKQLGVNLLPSLCSALWRTLKQSVTRFNPPELSEHRAITLITAGNAGQCALSWYFNYRSRPKIDHGRRASGCLKDKSSNKPECEADIKFLSGVLS